MVLKFSELRPAERQKRYKYLIVYPLGIVVAVLTMLEVNFFWIHTVLYLSILQELYLFGIMDDRFPYTKSEFVLDALCLLLFHLFSSWVIGPYILEMFSSLDSDSLYHLILSASVPPIVLFMCWYAYTQVGVKSEDNWKWRITGLFSTTETKVNG